MEVEDIKSPEYYSDREEDIKINFDPLKVTHLIIRPKRGDETDTIDETGTILTMNNVARFHQYMNAYLNIHIVQTVRDRTGDGLYSYVGMDLDKIGKTARFFEFHKYPKIDTLLLKWAILPQELPYVVRAPNLTTLSLDGDFMKDSGAKYLAKRKNLLSLNLQDNQITDKGARYFLFNTTLVDLKIAEGNNISQFLLTAINARIMKNREVLNTITSIAPVIAGTLRPKLKDDPLKYSMLDLTREISKMLGKESLSRTSLNRLFTVETNLVESQATSEEITGLKRKL